MDGTTANPTPDEIAAAEAEQAERLSRAAREAVRQPADPRLEKSFGHLGLFGDEDQPPAGAAARTAPAASVVPAPPAPVDLEPLRADLLALRLAVNRLDRRLGTVLGFLAILAVVTAILAVIVLVVAAT